MYFVNDTPVNSFDEAIAMCKSKPSTILTDSTGAVLMRHAHVTPEIFREIQLAKRILKMQLLYRKKQV